MRERPCARETNNNSHRHAELLQPLLFQLFGLKEELEAALALVVREVESVGPLQHKSSERCRVNRHEIKNQASHTNVL